MDTNSSVQKEKEVQEKIEEDVVELKKIASKQMVLQLKIQQHTKKIQELGSLPPDTLNKHNNVAAVSYIKDKESRELAIGRSRSFPLTMGFAASTSSTRCI